MSMKNLKKKFIASNLVIRIIRIYVKEKNRKYSKKVMNKDVQHNISEE